jgi:ribosome modulation factor
MSNFSQIWNEGRKANEVGVLRENCPYSQRLDPEERASWLEGWDGMQVIRAQWEADCRVFCGS